MKSKVKNFLVLFSIITLFINTAVFADLFFNLPAREISTNGQEAKIATNATGKYVYIAFITDVGEKLRVIRSTDFGRTFSDPIELDSDIGIEVQIITDDTGQYVNVIWLNDVDDIFTSVSEDFGKTFSNSTNSLDSGNNIQITASRSNQFVYTVWETIVAPKIHLRASSDFGRRWYPIIEIDGVSTSSDPQLITNNSGKYVYVVWIDGTSKNQVKVSSDFGDSFPTKKELSAAGANPQITTNSDGQFAEAIWEEGTKTRISRSQDFGQNWSSSVELGPQAFGSDPQIKTDTTGQYVHALFGDGDKILFRTSSDFGLNFGPTIEIGVANVAGGRALFATDITGRYVYIIWLDSNRNIQMRLSSNFGASFESATQLTASAESNLTIPDLAINLFGKYVYGLWKNSISKSVKFTNGIRLIFPKNVSIMPK